MLLKANQVVVFGNGFEAYQRAAACREYLDSIGQFETKIMVLSDQLSEFMKMMGPDVEEHMNEEMRKARISVVTGGVVTDVEGTHKIDKIKFKRHKDDAKVLFVRPDLVINEFNDRRCSVDWKDILFYGNPQFRPRYDYKSRAMIVDRNFSVSMGKVNNPVLACGESAQVKSFVNKGFVTTNDTKFNAETGHYAACQMMDKDVEFTYMPMARLSLPGREIYYVGERNTMYDEIIV